MAHIVQMACGVISNVTNAALVSQLYIRGRVLLISVTLLPN